MGSKFKEYTTEKLTGSVYTPDDIVSSILDHVGFNSPEVLGRRILDPACGDGQFLVEIVRRIIRYSPKRDLIKNLACVHGWELQGSPLEVCRQRLNSLLPAGCREIKWNLRQVDSLLENVGVNTLFTSSDKFDFIVANPPYVRIQNLDDATRAHLRSEYSFCRHGSTDIYLAFIELGLSLCSDDGVCGYVTPNSFMLSDAASRMRSYFVEHQSLARLYNFGAIQLFDNASTYSAILVYSKRPNKNFTFGMAVGRKAFNEREVNFSELNPSGAAWHLDPGGPMTPPSFSRPLGSVADIRVGLATLCDKAYVLRVREVRGDEVVLSGKYADEVVIEKDVLRYAFKASTAKKCDILPPEMIVFPYYVGADGTHVIIPEQEMARKYPKCYAYLFSVKELLDKRDNGRPNAVSWYAYGRSQGIDSCIGRKVIFSPISATPRFMICPFEEAYVYSGYFIKYDGDMEALCKQLNSDRMAKFISVAGKDMLGGWKGYSKKIVENFPVV